MSMVGQAIYDDPSIVRRLLKFERFSFGSVELVDFELCLCSNYDITLGQVTLAHSNVVVEASFQLRNNTVGMLLITNLIPTELGKIKAKMLRFFKILEVNGHGDALNRKLIDAFGDDGKTNEILTNITNSPTNEESLVLLLFPHNVSHTDTPSRMTSEDHLLRADFSNSLLSNGSSSSLLQRGELHRICGLLTISKNSVNPKPNMVNSLQIKRLLVTRKYQRFGFDHILLQKAVSEARKINNIQGVHVILNDNLSNTNTEQFKELRSFDDNILGLLQKYNFISQPLNNCLDNQLANDQENKGGLANEPLKIFYSSLDEIDEIASSVTIFSKLKAMKCHISPPSCNIISPLAKRLHSQLPDSLNTPTRLFFPEDSPVPSFPSIQQRLPQGSLIDGLVRTGRSLFPSESNDVNITANTTLAGVGIVSILPVTVLADGNISTSSVKTAGESRPEQALSSSVMSGYESPSSDTLSYGKRSDIHGLHPQRQTISSKAAKPRKLDWSQVFVKNPALQDTRAPFYGGLRRDGSSDNKPCKRVKSSADSNISEEIAAAPTTPLSSPVTEFVPLPNPLLSQHQIPHHHPLKTVKCDAHIRLVQALLTSRRLPLCHQETLPNNDTIGSLISGEKIVMVQACDTEYGRESGTVTGDQTRSCVRVRDLILFVDATTSFDKAGAVSDGSGGDGGSRGMCLVRVMRIAHYSSLQDLCLDWGKMNILSHPFMSFGRYSSHDSESTVESPLVEHNCQHHPNSTQTETRNSADQSFSAIVFRVQSLEELWNHYSFSRTMLS